MSVDRTRMFAFIADGEHDGVVAVSLDIPGIGPAMMPLVSMGDEDKLAWMREQARAVAKHTGKTIRLFEFTTPIEREVFTANPNEHDAPGSMQ